MELAAAAIASLEWIPIDNQIPTSTTLRQQNNDFIVNSHRSIDLTQIHGVVIQQVTQKSETIAQTLQLPYETNSEYKILELPPNVIIPPSNRDSHVWNPHHEDLCQLPEIFRVFERSHVGCRVLLSCIKCSPIKPLELHMYEHGVEKLLIKKPFRLGGWLGQSFNTNVYRQFYGHDGNKERIFLGTIREDFDPYCERCIEWVLCWSTHHVVMLLPQTGRAPLVSEKMHDRANESQRKNENDEKCKYHFNRHMCCCGLSNNFLGGTCLNYNAISSIFNYDDGTRLSGAQLMFAPDTKGKGLIALFRLLYKFPQIALVFPAESTQEDRLLLIALVLHCRFINA